MIILNSLTKLCKKLIRVEIYNIDKCENELVSFVYHAVLTYKTMQKTNTS